MFGIIDDKLSECEELLRNSYDDRGRLMAFPEDRYLRCLAMGKIAIKLGTDVTYTKDEINRVIRHSVCFDDIDYVRTEMKNVGFLGCLMNETKYWLEEEWMFRFNEFMER